MDLPKIAIETSEGRFVAELFPQLAPQTVKNFLAYVESDFYAGTLFHRVIDGFMIQGGGLDLNMQAKQTSAPIMNEARADTPNLQYTLAMARTADPHSATAQFFINVADNYFLDQPSKGSSWGYAVFGKVIDGHEVVMKISKKPTTTRAGYADVPIDAVSINKIELLKK